MRIDPETTGSEIMMLSQYLDYQRETVISKTDGLTGEQLAQTHASSELTLAGLLFHLSLVEENWMEVRFAGMPQIPDPHRISRLRQVEGETRHPSRQHRVDEAPRRQRG